MDISTLLLSVTFDRVIMVLLTAIMVLLTAIIASSAWSQAKSTQRQARLLEQQMEGEKARNTPKVSFNRNTYTYEQISFHGFTLTNSSPFDITITWFGLLGGIPEPEWHKTFTPIFNPPPIEEYKGHKLSDCRVPHRLKYGETMTVYFDDFVNFLLKNKETGQPIRVKPYCYDSLGNRHTMDNWLMWGKDSSAAFLDPGPGFITEEEWHRRRVERPKS